MNTAVATPAIAAPPLGGTAPVSEPNRAAELLARYARGDATAFEQLVAEHQDAAFALARHILGEGELAHDVVQEAFLRVLRNHQHYQVDKSFRAWLLHIVRNLAIDAIRRRRPHSSGQLETLTAAPAPVAMEGQELRERVATILKELPEKYREIIVMREMDGLGAEEIAQITGVDYGTTRWRLHKARNLFREAWISRFGEELP